MFLCLKDINNGVLLETVVFFFFFKLDMYSRAMLEIV